MIDYIANQGALAVGAMLFVVLEVAREVGVQIGRRKAAGGEQQGVGILSGAMLGPVAFVLALTLSVSSTRFEERRAGSLAEANAIGTAWLRAMAIDDPRGPEIARLLEDYTQLRKEFVEAPADDAAVDAINQRTSALQSEIWGHFAAISRRRADPIVAGLMNALNETFDMSTAERFAFVNQIGRMLFWLLTSIAVAAMAATGFQLGLIRSPHRILATLLTAMWTIIMVGILDLGAPRYGALRTSAVAYDWALQGFKGGMAIPPPPQSK